ncbi:MbcA/ParS/Xre antitoxin family protein [Kangiella shandongensis]|uniref:MbcA/ParS/Xre antitoxin family protein n=1 Tax=Kangiella shandongensis TaxID=2763258 RepID=UPI001CBAD025|nr:MbcA/ParS/Xre antitoxin family protein [Kangiella shandongensis]
MSDLDRILKKYILLLEKIECKPDLFSMAKETLGSEDAAIIWLISPHKKLNNQAPINSDDEEVKNLLLAIEHGVYL